MNGEQKETIIRLSDLGAAILRAFKPILVFVLIFAILGGVFGIRRTQRAAANTKVAPEELAEAEKTAVDANQAYREAENNLKTLEEISIPNAEATLAMMEQTFLGWQEYKDNSIYFSMDPFHRGVSRVTLFFRAPELEDDEPTSESADTQTDNEAEAFTRAFLHGTERLEAVRQIMNVDLQPTYIKELIRIYSRSERIVEFNVWSNDLAVAREASDYLLEAFLQYVSESKSVYSVTVIGRFDGYEVDWSLSKSHETDNDKINTARADYFTAKQTLEALVASRDDVKQIAELNRLLAAEAEEKLQQLHQQEKGGTPSRRTLVKSGIRFAVVFSVLGAILACVFVFLSMVTSGKLRNVNSVITRYPFPVIGVLPGKKKRLFGKTIRRLEGEPDLDYDSAGRAAAQSLISLKGDRAIALVSSENGSLLHDLEAFTGDRVPVCGNLLKDVDAVKAAEKYDGFVLVEAKGRSRFDLIDAEISRIRMLGKEIEGIVLL